MTESEHPQHPWEQLQPAAAEPPGNEPTGDEPAAEAPVAAPAPPTPWSVAAPPPSAGQPTEPVPPTAPTEEELLEPLPVEAPTAPGPTAQFPPAWPTWPPASPGTTPPGWGGAGGWGGPPPGPAGWPPPPQHPGQLSAGQRVLAVIAAIALVLASAGVGAAVAIAVHKDSTSQTTAPRNPFDPNNGNGFTNPFGNGNGNGNGNSGSQSTGPLNVDDIAAKVDPALVNIDTTLSGGGRAAGSGMIISPSGAVLTNNHVIADSTSIKVTIGGKGSAKTAHVVGYDVQDDVALLQIDDVSNLPTITFGDPSGVQVGDPVVAIGNALGKGGTPTAVQGKVTALDQQVTAGDPGGQSETLQGMIQIDAPIQPGDSGGALIDKDAKVIGMNTAAAGGQFQIQTGSNIGFAIPLDNAISVVKQIQTGKDTDRVHIGPRALLGVQVRDVNANSGFGDTPSQVAPVDSGALIVGVQDNTGASDAGMQAGDVITSVDGKNIADSQSLHLALTVYHPGDQVKVSWVDASGNHHDANVKLAEGPPA